jgi:AcrR family transcriptional regulator
MPQRKNALTCKPGGPILDLNQPRWAALEAVVRSAFASDDFHRVDMRRLAKDAGMGFGTIYRNFGSKEGLLFAFVAKWQDQLAARVADQITGLASAEETFRKIFWCLLDYYDRNPEVGSILFLTLPMKTWMADETFRQTELTKVLLDAANQAQTSGAIGQKLPAHLYMDMILGLVHRHFTMWIYRNRPGLLAEAAPELFASFWQGVAR